MLIINYKMDIESLQIKNKYYYDCDQIIIYLKENQKLMLIFIILDTSQILMIL